MLTLTYGESVGAVHSSCTRVFGIVEHAQYERVGTVDVGHLSPACECRDDVTVRYDRHADRLGCQ